MELFFADPDQISDNEIVLDDFERKHVLQSLRKSTGDEIFVTDGQGTLFRTRVLQDKPQLKLYIIESEEKERPLPLTGLAVGYIRPARLDFIFEKGTELGVSEFYLIRTRHANYFSENIRRYEKIIRQALKQSQQFYLPKISVFSSLEKFINQIPAYSCKISAIDATYSSLFQKIFEFDRDSSTSFLYIVGPEGGFSQDEIKLLNNSAFVPVSLGKNRLRAETAAISGISLIKQYIHQ